jgi:MerR family transcriptional regulator, repressor of the yfmOP operon
VTDMKERPTGGVRLLKIQEAAAEVGLTARSVRYYEEMGLLRPAARSEGDYRLYDESDLERLRFIKGLRDDAGFSLAEISKLLEDEEARERDHVAYHATADPAERVRLLRERVASFERQTQTLRTKIDRLAAMVEDTEARRLRSLAKIAEIERAAASTDTANASPARIEPGAPDNR